MTAKEKETENAFFKFSFKDGLPISNDTPLKNSSSYLFPLNET